MCRNDKNLLVISFIAVLLALSGRAEARVTRASGSCSDLTTAVRDNAAKLGVTIICDLDYSDFQTVGNSAIDDLHKGDLYLPKATYANLPELIVVHGGGFSCGKNGDKSKAAMQPLVAASQGYIAFSINWTGYEPSSICDPQSKNQGVQDVQLAIRWLRAHRDEYSGGINRFFLSGGSAGATVAGEAGLLDHISTNTGNCDTCKKTAALFSSVRVDVIGMSLQYVGPPGPITNNITASSPAMQIVVGNEDTGWQEQTECVPPRGQKIPSRKASEGWLQQYKDLGNPNPTSEIIYYGWHNFCGTPAPSFKIPFDCAKIVIPGTSSKWDQETYNGNVNIWGCGQIPFFNSVTTPYLEGTAATATGVTYEDIRGNDGDED